MSSLVASPATVAPSSNAHKPSVVVKRRNALVPLPLLPPVPKNTIVTSVKILHNQDPDSPPESPTSDEDGTAARDPAPPKEDNEAKTPPMSPTQTSPTQTSFKFSNKRARPQRRRSCCTPCSPPPCTTTARGVGGGGNAPPPPDMSQVQSPPGTPGELGTPPDTNSTNTKIPKVRKPRSTIVVTVRLANPAPPPIDASPGTNYYSSPSPPTTGPAILSRQKSRNFTALSLKKSRFMNLHTRDVSQASNNIPHSYSARANSPPPTPPVPPRPMWNKPRISSNLASCKPIYWDDPDIIMEDDIAMETETEDVLYVSAGSPPLLSGRLNRSKSSILKARSTSGFRAATAPNNRPVKSKKGKASKTGSRLAMLRWAVLNQSGPEVGMRIKAMGVRLAKEIWEAERCLDEDDEEEMVLERGTTTMEGTIVSSAAASVEQDKIMQDVEEEETTTTLQTERERIAEECIRELEDMDVDQEVDQEMAPAVTAIEQDEQRVEDTAAVLPHEDAMDIDTPTTTITTSTVTVQQPATITPKTTSPPTTQTTPTSRSQRRLSFPKRLQVRVDCEVQVLSKTTSTNGTTNNNFPRRRSLADDNKLPIMVAAKKWFEKTAL